MRISLVSTLILAFSCNAFSQVDMHKYAPILETKVKNEELAEVLGLCEVKAELSNETYLCRIFEVFNGPSDPGFEGCNNSCYYYISNATYDLPFEFRLFKIGPFYELDSISLEEYSIGFRLVVHHRRFEKVAVSKFLIEFNGVRKDK